MMRDGQGELLLARIIAEFVDGGWTMEPEVHRNEGILVSVERALADSDGGVYSDFRACLLAGVFDWEFWEHHSEVAALLYQVGAAFRDYIDAELRDATSLATRIVLWN